MKSLARRKKVELEVNKTNEKDFKQEPPSKINGIERLLV
jgi:hypothetical protein